MPGKGSHNILNIRGIIDDAKCFHTVRELRWSDGVRCAHCGSDKDGDGFCEVHINTMEGFWSLIAFPITSSSWYLSGIITKLSWVLRVRAQRETARRKIFAVPASAIPRRPTWNPIKSLTYIICELFLKNDVS